MAGTFEVTGGRVAIESRPSKSYAAMPVRGRRIIVEERLHRGAAWMEIVGLPVVVEVGKRDKED